MRAGLSIVRLSWRLVAVVILLGSSALVWGQDTLGTKVGLKKAFDAAAQDRDKFITGERKATAKGDARAAEVAQAAAQYYLFRFTHQTEIPLQVQGDFTKVVEKVLDRKDDNNRVFVDEYFGPALAESMKETLDWGVKFDRSALIHASMMLPAMGKLTSRATSDKLGAWLVELVKDPKTHDVIRLYALKALKEAMPITEQPEGTPLQLDLKSKKQNDQRSRDTKYVDALTAYVDAPFDAATLKDEEQYVAKRYIRHYAIVSLAQAGSPAVMAYAEKVGKKKAPDGPVAPTLLKVLVEKVPPNQNPNIRMLILKDKVEAALGLCNMSYKNMPEYDPTLATYLVGATLLDFVDEYNKDLQNFNAKAGAARKLPMHPFKIDAKRLEAGLKRHADTSKTKGAVELYDAARTILKDVADYGQSLPGKIGDLEKKVAELRPPGAAVKVFRTLPDAPKIVLPAAN